MTTYLGKSCSFCLPRVPFVNCRQFMYLVISLLVLRAGYGIWLYQFLIIAYLFTLHDLCWPNNHLASSLVIDLKQWWQGLASRPSKYIAALRQFHGAMFARAKNDATNSVRMMFSAMLTDACQDYDEHISIIICFGRLFNLRRLQVKLKIQAEELNDDMAKCHIREESATCNG